MSTIDFNRLKLLAVFVEVVSCGSFAAAARKLRSSRSRVSEQVAQLESSLGVRLLNRTTRQLSMTMEGREVFARASDLPDILADVEVASSQEVARGRVALTVNHDIAIARLLPALESFQQRYPRVQLDLVLSDDRLDLIAEQIDVAIRVGVPRDDSLIMRPLFEDRMQVFATPEYVRFQGEPGSLSELAGHRWIMVQQASPMAEVNMYQGDQPVSFCPENYHMCNSPLMAQRMVLAGLGVGCLLPSTVADELQAGRLVRLMPDLQGEALQFSLVYPSRRQMPLRTRCLIEHLLAAKLFV